MRRLITALARLLGGRASTSQEVTPIGFVPRTGGFSEAHKRDLDALIRRELESGVPGLTVAVLDNGKIVWSDGYGVANSVSRRAMTVNTRLEAASLGKPITTYAALRLVESGKLELRRPLSSYLREQFVRNDQRRGRGVTPACWALRFRCHSPPMRNPMLQISSARLRRILQSSSPS